MAVAVAVVVVVVSLSMWLYPCCYALFGCLSAHDNVCVIAWGLSFITSGLSVPLSSGGGGGDGVSSQQGTGPSTTQSTTSTEDNTYAASLYKVPQFASMGSLFRSSKPQPLTESELEYLVDVVKHVFPKHVVFQFNVKNTVPEQVLLNVNIDMDSPDDEVWQKVRCNCDYGCVTVIVLGVVLWLLGCCCDCNRLLLVLLLLLCAQVVSIPIAKVVASSPGVAYVAFQRNPDAGFPSTTFPCEMKFNVADCDPDTGEPDGEGYEDVFPLEAVELGTCEFMAKVPVPNFRAAWESMGESGEVLESYGLNFKNLPDAANAVFDFLGMAPCDGTGVVKEGTTKHSAYASGVFLGGVKVLARMMLVIEEVNGCVLKINVRSEDPQISRVVADCIH